MLAQPRMEMNSATNMNVMQRQTLEIRIREQEATDYALRLQQESARILSVAAEQEAEVDE